MPDNTRNRVLLVDRFESSREKIRSLMPASCELQEAATGTAAVAAFEQQPADCVLLDAELPDTTDHTLLEHFVAHGAAVVVLANEGDQGVGLAVMKRGAQDYFDKRFLNEAALSRVIAYSAERSRLMRENLRVVAALRDSERKFNDVVSRIDEGLWVREASDGSFSYLSPAFERILGRSIAEVREHGFLAFVHPDDHGASVGQPVGAVDEFRETFRVLRPDGETRSVENRGFPVHDPAGKLLRVSGIVRDVTEIRRQEQALRLAQKLEAIGQLAAGIAHEINTPGQYVSDNLAFLADAAADLRPLLEHYQAMARGETRSAADLRDAAEAADLAFLAEEIPTALAQARQGMHQIKQIVLAMKDFSHPGEEKESIDLNRAVRSTVTVARNEWKYVAELDLELDDALPAVACIPSAINQVLLNLIVNAAHAIGAALADGDKGRITVRTRVEDDHAVIEVQDNGTGIPAHIQGRIFDPFFTTKEVGKGTGQGLAMAYAVVHDRHAGTISVDSTPGLGATFEVRLPLS